MNELYKDSSYPTEQRIQDLISRMTIEEKIGQMVQISLSTHTMVEAEEWVTKRFAGSFLYAFDNDVKHLQKLALNTRLGVPIIFGIDATHGHALHKGATVFPSQLAMSCSWNPELVERAGRVTARETAADGIHWTFSPLLCIGRDLRWGRINETFGEDPHLIGVLASAIIRGYQGKALSDEDSIAACAKHYIAYGESVGGKDAYDSQVSMRKVREVFLPPFKEAVKSGCATFIASYQSIDGTPASANKKILRDILREELGFDGFVVTDWDNVNALVVNQMVASSLREAAKLSIEAGNDMIMSTPAFYDEAVALVKCGAVSEKLIDEAVEKILNVKFRLGLFENGKLSGDQLNSRIFACPEHLDAALELARESIVLLENRNNTLPLGKNIKKLAVIGPNSDDLQSQYGDWTYLSHDHYEPEGINETAAVTMLKGIQDLAGLKGIEVLYQKGCDLMDEADEDISKAVACVMQTDAAVVAVGDGIAQNGEFKDRADLSLSGAQQKLLEALKATGKPIIVILVNGKPLSIPWVAANADAVIETFNSGMLGGKAAAEILFGEVNPSGKLSISFPYHSGQLPVYYNHQPGWHSKKYVDFPAEPLYSFGYGLSYTTFKYDNLRLSKQKCGKEDTVFVSVDVTNSGKVDGKEIVQLYVNDLVSSVITPVKELKGFSKVEIKSGETRTVSIPLEVSSLAIIDQDEKKKVEAGEFQVMVGPDSRDEVLLKTLLTVE
ncbi:MAG TPA: glycoside hydrolase family 3 N-terminal domain-containing protein [Clostridia bacterium]|nr:glycoside hydrolase family 3 N-terminal domain-containing protein [Clostridia bacterium]